MSQAIILADTSIDFAISAWLHEKKGRTGSERTERAYARNILAFRGVLQSQGLDLNSDTRAVGILLQGWASASRLLNDTAPATHNQRLSSISSFYEYAIRNDLCGIKENPARRVKARPVQSYRKAIPLTPTEIQRTLKDIDRSTLSGKRDYALLLIALTTGRRLSELAKMRWEDIDMSGIVTFYAKGGKEMRDQLKKPVLEALSDWKEHNCREYVWLSLSRNGSNGAPLSIQAIEQICNKHFGTTRFHALRHTFAHSMEAAGANVTDIQRRLGHSNIATTGRYLEAMRSDENQFADELVRMFGIG